MNPSTMKELFKAEYGSSIAAHIRQHRMEKASALLLESGDSLAQVARAVGYESQSKFSAEFKKVFGMLPSEFRKLHAGH
jgi:AraC-like DNA-binding protein